MAGLHGDRGAEVATLADGLHQGYLTQQGNLQFLGQLTASVAPEDIVAILGQLGRREPRHILDETEDRYADFLVAEHLHALARIDQGDGLRRSDHDDAREPAGPR